ncbi:hypothetical protein C1T31_02355 [Hanstruepera neustonica]|uniref:Uncharacterized protein n=1 Tax=Hanstruepera neustonica TaxID=1445657 RepID=A0A2K1E3Z1_9FLAO|nr:hypothetical protein [Hanstruepera neustonica]PNQ74998.1 hypothetical protein C1T31_02355 [Hanstruepera neustonica]
MKTATIKPALLPRLYCSVFGHDFEVSRKVTGHVKEYTCSHCKKELTTNGNGNLTILTPKYREINSILEQMYTRRLMRLQNRQFLNSDLRIPA